MKRKSSGPFSEEHKQRISAANKARQKPIKQCNDCQQPYEGWNNSKRCEPCRAKARKQQALAAYAANPQKQRNRSLAYLANPEKREMQNERRRRQYLENPEKYRAIAREWARAHRSEADLIRKRIAARERAFGITPEQYEERLAAQEGVCAICRQLCKTGRNLAVDHCHTTGKVRGLLCTNCNQGIGSFKDSPDLLRRAALYIEQAN